LIRFEAAAEGGSTQVLIGDIADAADAVRAMAGGASVPLVTDQRLLSLYGDTLAGLFAFEPILVPEGEPAKCWDVLQRLIERFAQLGADRSRPIVAFGGGSVGDVAGLAASLFKRGCPVIHIPTTLLSQVDSALGGKTAIDALGQKNLVGTFHLPAMVVTDPAFLDTLDPRQMRSGYAEVVKYGAIDDPAFFDWCEANGGALLAGDSDARFFAIEHCLRAKARFVADDLRDTSGRRALLNLGHSFGHAIESLTGLESVLHGEGVAIGLCMAFAFSAVSGLCTEADAHRIRDHFDGVGLPTSLAAVGLAGRGADLLLLIQRDKKAECGSVNLVLARGIGQAFLARGVDIAALAPFLSRAP
jgi:3-dehydroquinate synthase